MNENVLLCGSQRNLVGILTEPEKGGPAGDPGTVVLLLNSGLLHRAAPHRMYVHLARRLAGRGRAAFRFDLAGYGDSLESAFRKKQSPEENALEDVLAVMDDLQREERGYSRFALSGICSGAYLAVKIANSDPRVVAAVPINTPVELFTSNRPFIARLESELAARDLRGDVLLDTDRWRRLLRGQIGPQRIVDILLKKLKPDSSSAEPDEPDLAEDRLASLEELQRLAQGGRRACLVFSRGELGYEFLERVVGRESMSLAAPDVELRLMDNADHLFIQHRSADRFIDELCEWFSNNLPAVLPAEGSDDRPNEQ